MYQFTGTGGWNSYYFKTRLTIDSKVISHTMSHPGYTRYAGNFGLWQGNLGAATHKIVVQYVNSYRTESRPET